MKIFHIRPGFATNSSSNHVVAIFKNKPTIGDSGDCCFGCGQFTATSRDSKRKYMLATLLDNLQYEAHRLDEASMRAVCDTFFPFDPGDYDAYVDHQSVMVLPRQIHGKGISRGFFSDLMYFMLRDDVGILGMSDQGDAHPLYNKATIPSWHRDIAKDSDAIYVGRKDGPYWTLFCKESKYQQEEAGTKIRISFEDVPAPTHSSLPELVDVKITDVCHHGCSYCYQGSSPEGQQADYESLMWLADALESMKVFEVAIGGGNPASHTDLGYFVASLVRKGIVPNITVRSLNDLDKVSTEDFGAVGVSVLGMDEARKTMALARKRKYNNVVLHHIVGTESTARLINLLRYAHHNDIPILLLGWKTQGRAAAFAPFDIDMAQVIEKAGLYQVRMDTCLVNKYRKVLKEDAYESTWEDATEGAFSMYIDAVNMTANRSSYADTPATTVQKEDGPMGLIRTFQSYHKD